MDSAKEAADRAYEAVRGEKPPNANGYHADKKAKPPVQEEFRGMRSVYRNNRASITSLTPREVLECPALALVWTPLTGSHRFLHHNRAARPARQARY